ncbi:MAG: hypothetical protein U1E83_08510 [Methylotetracoccus sp.]
MNTMRTRSSFLRRLERSMVGMAMGALAYLLERAVIRSIREGEVKAVAGDPWDRK